MVRNASLILTCCAVCAGARSFGQFTPGNLVIYDRGTVANGTSDGYPIILREFSPSGVPVQTITLPTSGPNAILGDATNTSHGMSLSPAGDKLIIAGYANYSAPGSGYGSAT